jgi:hypothetical protein
VARSTTGGRPVRLLVLVIVSSACGRPGSEAAT